jgi:hypothetical protein
MILVLHKLTFVSLRSVIDACEDWVLPVRARYTNQLVLCDALVDHDMLWYEKHSFCEWVAFHRSGTKNVDCMSQSFPAFCQWHDYSDNYFKRWACRYRCIRDVRIRMSTIDVRCRRDRLVSLCDKLEPYVSVIKMIVSSIHLDYFLFLRRCLR